MTYSITDAPRNLMRIAGAFLLLILFYSQALSQISQLTRQASSPTQHQFKPDDLCTVEGSVVNANTGEPVKKIAVSLYPVGRAAQPRTALTDVTGKFVMAGVEPGGYFLSAGGNGYPFQSFGQKRRGGRGKVITLAPGAHENSIVFRLPPAAVITGTVYDEDGDPVMGASVQAFHSARGVRYGRGVGPMGSAQTDDRGVYRIFGLEAGEYYLVADRPNQNDTAGDVYLPTYHPSTPDPAQSIPVELGPGSELSAINLNLVRGHSVSVRGHIVNLGSGKTQGAYVQLLPAATKSMAFNPRNYGAPTQDEKGDFEIKGVPPGSYVLNGGWNDGKQAYAGRVAVEVGSVDVDGVSLVIRTPIDIHGRVRADRPGPLDLGRLQVWLQEAEPSIMGGGSGAEMKDDGTFIIHNLFEGSYQLRVAGYPEEYYLKSASLGGEDVPLAAVPISAAQSQAPLQIELSLNGGSVAGTVLQDQKPVPGALVTLIPDPPHRSRDEMYSSKTADELGRFNMLGLPPGKFKLFAWEVTGDTNVMDPEFLKPYEDRGAAVVIEEGHAQNVQLELIPAAAEPK